MTAFNDTFGIIGFSSENVGIDRRIYTGLTSTNPQLNVNYNGGRVDVYLNGVKLMGNHSGQSNYDYTYQNTGSGSAITLSTGVALVATDTIECVGYVSNSSNTVTTYTPSVSAGNNTFTSISHTSSDLLNVFLNGVLLDPSDYTADASADTVAITSLASGDVVHIQVIGALDHSDFVPAGGGTFSGDVDIANAELEVSNTGTTGNIPTIRLKNTEVNVGNGDVLGQIDWKSEDSGRSGDPVASIKAVSSEADGSHTDLTFSTGENADVASEKMRIDSSGNVGIGVSPATTTNNRKNLQVGLGATVIGRTDDTPNFLSSNLTYDSGWKYIANTTASQVELGTNFKFHTAISGNAGDPATLTERMRIDSSGSITTPNGQFDGEIGASATFASALFNKGTNGYVILPSGIEIKWGLTGQISSFGDGNSTTHTYTSDQGGAFANATLWGMAWVADRTTCPNITGGTSGVYYVDDSASSITIYGGTGSNAAFVKLGFMAIGH